MTTSENTYTPTIDEVREVWRIHSGRAKYTKLEFDRFIASVKAGALREADRCTNCGLPIQWREEYGEWMHGSGMYCGEPLCGDGAITYATIGGASAHVTPKEETP